MSVVIENQARTVTERAGRAAAGLAPAVAIIAIGIASALLLVRAIVVEDVGQALAAAAVLAGAVFAGFGLYMLQPNQAGVLTFFGDYRGTDRAPGLRWTNPLYRRRKISLRVRNFNTTTSKVNDANGNPIQVAAVVVWQVVDTGRAAFEVDDFVDYVTIQAEAAVRHMARSYPYDSFEDTQVVTLIGDVDEVNDSLSVELQERLGAAGVEVLEARLTDLSYAPEIAEAIYADSRPRPSSRHAARSSRARCGWCATPSPASSRATATGTRSHWIPIGVRRSRLT